MERNGHRSESVMMPSERELSSMQGLTLLLPPKFGAGRMRKKYESL